MYFTSVTDTPMSLAGKWKFLVGIEIDIDEKKKEIARLEVKLARLPKDRHGRIHRKLKKARVELVALTLAK